MTGKLWKLAKVEFGTWTEVGLLTKIRHFFQGGSLPVSNGAKVRCKQLIAATQLWSSRLKKSPTTSQISLRLLTSERLTLEAKKISLSQNHPKNSTKTTNPSQVDNMAGQLYRSQQLGCPRLQFWSEKSAVNLSKVVNAKPSADQLDERGNEIPSAGAPIHKECWMYLENTFQGCRNIFPDFVQFQVCLKSRLLSKSFSRFQQSPVIHWRAFQSILDLISCDMIGIWKFPIALPWTQNLAKRLKKHLKLSQSSFVNWVRLCSLELLEKFSDSDENAMLMNGDYYGDLPRFGTRGMMLDVSRFDSKLMSQ